MGTHTTALTIQGQPPLPLRQTCSLFSTDYWPEGGWHSTEMPSSVLYSFIRYSRGNCCPEDVNMLKVMSTRKSCPLQHDRVMLTNSQIRVNG